jgi:GT2 family glycosyltransferase
MLDVSIVIVSWNTRDLLARCLSAVYESSEGLSFEVIVIDNASQDDSALMLKNRFPDVILIENEANLGFAIANNIGVDQANGRFILLLNSDAFVHANAVETLVRSMEAMPDTGASGCRLYYEDGQLQRTAYSFPTVLTELWTAVGLDKLFPKSRVFGKYRMTYWDLDDIREVDYVMGACLMLRREALEQTGALDENYFMYSEEVDLCYRLKRAGWKVRFISTASATHIWGGSSRLVQDAETIYRLYSSRMKFFRKFYGSLRTYLYKIVLVIHSSIRILASIFTGWFIGWDKAFRMAYNYYVLLRRLPTL